MAVANWKKVGLGLGVLAAALGVGRHVWQSRAAERALQKERRSQVTLVAPAHLNADSMLDIVVGYHPAWGDKPGTRFSVIEGFDGATGERLWSSRVANYLIDSNAEGKREFAVGQHRIAFTGFLPNTDLAGVVWVHDLATGALRWEKEFPQSYSWAGAFRVWPDDELLLVLANTAAIVDSRSREDASLVLHAYDFDSGEQRWSVPIRYGFYDSAPAILNDKIVLVEPSGDDHGKRLVIIDRNSGHALRVPASDGYEPVVAHDDVIWTHCQFFDGCESGAALKNVVESRCPDKDARCLNREVFTARADGWLATIDSQTGIMTAVTLPNGDLQRLEGENESLIETASYENLIIKKLMTFNGPPLLVATPVGKEANAWVLPMEEGYQFNSSSSEHEHNAPSAAPFHGIGARYLPLMVYGDGAKLLIVDLRSGGLVWRSSSFTPGQLVLEAEPFTYIAGKYYFNMETREGAVLLSIDGQTGKFDGVYQIESAIDGEVKRGRPNGKSMLAPIPWHFDAGKLTGTWGGAHSWIIDLDRNRLQFAHPAGVKLLTPWSAAEDILGPMPRETVLDPSSLPTAP